MVKVIYPHDTPITLKSDLAAEFPIYFYIPEDKSALFYSYSIKGLLDDPHIPKPLDVSMRGISFLIQSGIIPHPETVLKNVYTIGIGDTVEVRTENGKIIFSYDHDFPFRNKYRKSTDEMVPDEEHILKLLADATIKRIDDTKQKTILFHSAGKDSNMIALALKKAGYTDIVSVTQQTAGEENESAIVKSIAEKCGFQHKALISPEKIDQRHLDLYDYYFTNITLPNIDKVALAFPLYLEQMDFTNSNIIDGSGNDVFIGLIPPRKEYTRQKLLRPLQFLRTVADFANSETNLKNIALTRVERASMRGFSFKDVRKLNAEMQSVYPYWKNVSAQRSNWDYLDVRADMWGTFIDIDKTIGKTARLCEITNSNLITPWPNEQLASYISQLPEVYLFDRNNLKNKLLLRKILKEQLDLDSDRVGKRTYSFDFRRILGLMLEHVKSEILSCSLWDKKGAERLLNRMLIQMHKNGSNSYNAASYIQRLYIISAWYNKNKYLHAK